jgi:Na+-driven multidrug efflux pump
MIIPVSIAVVTGMVAAYGPSAVAGFGVSSRIDIFALAVTISLGAVLSPFVGQNWGAGLKQRVDIAVTHSFRFTFGWGLLVFLVFIVAGRPVAALFSDNPEVIATIVLYLAMVPLSYAFQGMLNLANSVLNVLQKPLHAAALTAVQMFVLLIPLAYIGSSLFGLVGIFGAIITANTIAGIVGYFVLRRAIEAVTWETSPRAAPQTGVSLSAEGQESPA